MNHMDYSSSFFSSFDDPFGEDVYDDYCDIPMMMISPPTTSSHKDVIARVFAGMILLLALLG